MPGDFSFNSTVSKLGVNNIFVNSTLHTYNLYLDRMKNSKRTSLWGRVQNKLCNKSNLIVYSQFLWRSRDFGTNYGPQHFSSYLLLMLKPEKQTPKMILNAGRINVNSEKKSESQMAFETTTLRDLVRCFNHRATGDLFINFAAYHKGLLDTVKHIVLAVVYYKLCVK